LVAAFPRVADDPPIAKTPAAMPKNLVAPSAARVISDRRGMPVC
jgi:hypothetical protein